ncbi:diguanylate cyclase with PAS/PAC and GAF sensors [Thermodesulfobium narugense DSM 14796]|uniref:Diguanylate cyclase with PAS/PAC and GAF sensors n=1 Tax=Thermodesulfobium narugense DSM 14796 TaxID=747365 RepID=M1E4U1_9BACT|nr:diguanylate cyclase [Thermodesulfobium narugense]AEE14537.1 diguanylate cyclase with PAS/PAC and GAF sensors [Thermodesulfobium narugense DSM 14796]
MILNILKRIRQYKILTVFLLFLPTIFVIFWIVNSEVLDFFNAQLIVENDARNLASLYAAEISKKLDSKFETLKFIGSLLLSNQSSDNVVDKETANFIRYLTKFYSDTPAFSIYSKEDKIIFTTLPKINDVPKIKFFPVSKNPDYQLGLVHIGLFHTEVLNERYILRDSLGKPLYYIRTAYFLDNLLSSDIKSKKFNLIVKDLRNNELLGRLSDGIFIKNASIISGNEIIVIVPGYPFEIKAVYPKKLIWETYINTSLKRLFVEGFVLFLMILVNVFIFFYINKKEREKKNLQRIVDFGTVLTQINQLISNVQDELTLYQSICDIAVNYGHLKLAFVAKPDKDGVFRILAATGETDYAYSAFISIKPEIPEGQGSSGKTWRNKIPNYVQSFEKENFTAPWRNLAKKYGIKSSATIPIFKKDDIWATLSVYHSEENVFTGDLKKLLEELSKDISIGLDRLDFRKRENEISKIRKSIIENALIGIALVKNRIFLQVNPKFAQIFGYSDLEELIGKPTKILFFDEEEYKRVDMIYNNLFANKKVELIELHQKRKDNQLIICEATVNVIDEDEKVTIWTVQDITERKKAQLELERAYFLLNNIIENLPDATFVINYEGKIISWNKALEALTGKTKEKMIGKNYIDYSVLFYDEPRPLLANLILNKNEKFLKENYKVIYKSENIIYAETFTPKIYNNTGAYVFVAVSKLTDREGNVIGAIESIRDITENKKMEEELYELSVKDSLTDSYNRRYFEKRLEEEIERTKRSNIPFSLIMLDIDDFKVVNDNYGHEIGDKVLINIVKLVKNRIRKTDFIARWGGEEFMILLTNTNLHFAKKLALELKGGMYKLDIPEIEFVTASFGVTTYHESDTVNSIVKRVDKLMYAAKAAGKDCVMCDFDVQNL